MKISISKSLLKTFTENKLLFFIENIFHQKMFFFSKKTSDGKSYYLECFNHLRKYAYQIRNQNCQF